MSADSWFRISWQGSYVYKSVDNKLCSTTTKVPPIRMVILTKFFGKFRIWVRRAVKFAFDHNVSLEMTINNLGEFFCVFLRSKRRFEPGHLLTRVIKQDPTIKFTLVNYS